MSVDFSTAELRTILRAHPGRKRDGTVRPRGEQAIRTMMSAITTHYRRVHGESSGSLGDLTWITADSFVQPSQAVNIASVTDLAASGQRRLADNLRSALMSATAHIGASPDLSQDEKNRLRNAWDAEYRGLTDIAQRLERDEQLRVFSGQLSERQLKNWIHWVDLRTIVGTVVQEAIADFGSADASALGSEIGRFKALQTSVQLAMHVMLPPVRNDFAGLRFVEGEPDTDDLRASQSPNYIQVAPDGSMELVINAFKTDGHTSADTYDPTNGDFVLGLDTTLRIPLVSNATLTKFGFAPEVLATLLGLYRRTLRTVFGARNNKEYLFFDFKSDAVVTPVHADALGKRIGRKLKSLTGKAPRTQLFRTMFCTWFLNDADPAPTRADRQLMAKMMMHSEERQLCNYNKRLTRSQVPVQAKRLRTLAPEPEETGEL